MGVEVVQYSCEWPRLFSVLADELRKALRGVPVVGIEHVGSTAVPSLAAKPILDVDIIVRRELVADAIRSLEEAGYVHQGDLGMTDREAFFAPDDNPPRHVYVCVQGTLHLRNHLAVRDALRAHTALRDRYGAVKLELASDPELGIPQYIAGKSEVLQDILVVSGLSVEERARIWEMNTRA